MPLSPRENPLVPVEQLPGLLRTVDALLGTGIVVADGPATFWFEKDGDRFTLDIQLLPASEQGNLDTQPQTAGYEPPLYLSDQKTLYWFRYLEAPHALYIQYNACAEMASLSFADFSKRLMAAADERPVETIVIDMRHNGGGNSAVIDPLMAALKSRPKLRRKAICSRSPASTPSLPPSWTR